MEALTTVVVIALLPAAVAGAVLAAGRLVHAAGQRRRRRSPAPVGPPLERVAADLRRLLTERATVRGAPGLAVRARRLRVLDAAITDAALDAARALELPVPDRVRHEPLPPAQLRLLLTRLADSGLVLPPLDGSLR